MIFHNIHINYYIGSKSLKTFFFPTTPTLRYV